MPPNDVLGVPATVGTFLDDATLFPCSLQRTVARSGVGEVRTSAPKDGNPAAGNNIPERSHIQQSARFNEQRGQEARPLALVDCS